MNTEHTPGPWRVDYTQGIVTKDGVPIAYVYNDYSDTPLPDARLIAAAPELLEVLKTLADYPIAGGYALGPCITECDMKEIRAAIAKAEGTTQNQ